MVLYEIGRSGGLKFDEPHWRCYECGVKSYLGKDRIHHPEWCSLATDFTSVAVECRYCGHTSIKQVIQALVDEVGGKAAYAKRFPFCSGTCAADHIIQMVRKAEASNAIH